MTSPLNRVFGFAAVLALTAGQVLAQDGEKPNPEKPAPDKPAPDAPKPETPEPAEPGQPARGGGAPPSPDAIAKGSPATPPSGAARELMWPAADAEGWKKPVLVKFQRTWEDAVAVSKETKKQILVCINMDGEISSEHYAGVRYRQPEIAKLYEPYVCVIASVYRHNPRDYDDEGRRILCPRFGSVTCGEHIAIEPILFEKFLDGKRVAPRHILVDLEGKEKFDVYYANDTASVFRAITDGVPPDQPPPVVRGDRPITERVASRDMTDRAAVETAYQSSDAAARKALLEAAMQHPETAPLDLLRLAVFGLDSEAAKQAREALTQSKDVGAVDVIAEALRVPMADPERDALIAALSRLGEKSANAQWLATSYAGLSGRSSTVDTKAWATAGGTYEAVKPEADWSSLDDERVRAWLEAKAKPEDAKALTELAESNIAQALKARVEPGLDPRTRKYSAAALFEDARNAAARAEAAGGATWRTNSVVSIADYYGERLPEAYSRAEAAVKEIPAGDPSRNTLIVFTVYAESRWKAIQKAVRDKQMWPPQLITDLNAANTVLLRHPLGTDAQAIWHYDFLSWLRAKDHAMRFLGDAISQFPASSELHDRLRRRLLAERGVDALEPAYADLLAKKDASPVLGWYSAIASRVAGDIKRRTGLRDQALPAYDRAVAAFEKAIAADPARKAAGDEAVTLLLAGRARLAFDLGDDDRALSEILASLERGPSVAGTRDGGGMTPGEVAQAILVRLTQMKRDADAEKLKAALAKIDPELLRFDRNE